MRLSGMADGIRGKVPLETLVQPPVSRRLRWERDWVDAKCREDAEFLFAGLRDSDGDSDSDHNYYGEFSRAADEGSVETAGHSTQIQRNGNAALRSAPAISCFVEKWKCFEQARYFWDFLYDVDVVVDERDTETGIGEEREIVTHKHRENGEEVVVDRDDASAAGSRGGRAPFGRGSSEEPLYGSEFHLDDNGVPPEPLFSPTPKRRPTRIRETTIPSSQIEAFGEKVLLRWSLPTLQQSFYRWLSPEKEAERRAQNWAFVSEERGFSARSAPAVATAALAATAEAAVGETGKKVMRDERRPLSKAAGLVAAAAEVARDRAAEAPAPKERKVVGGGRYQL